MQIQKFHVSRLFGAFERTIPFPTHSEEEQTVSLVLLHGPNGSGKTTSLKMIDGFMQLDFGVFRQVPFGEASLTFSTGDAISVAQSEPGAPLHVQFGDESVMLHPERSGPHDQKHAAAVTKFRTDFFSTTESINFEYINTRRQAFSQEFALVAHEREFIRSLTRHGDDVPHEIRNEHAQQPSVRVARFIADAQVNYRRFFRSSGPDFLSAIIERLKEPSKPNTTTQALINRLAAVKEQEKGFERLGVESPWWDFDLASEYLENLTEPTVTEGLSVMTAAAEVLESLAREQQLLADRLQTFERNINRCMVDKNLMIEPKRGLRITGAAGQQLTEEQLSSGEYHLLYLMVAALTTQRRGTVLAIDEPELSMHIAWQRSLIDSLLECTSNASPQLLLATHSPDIVGTHRDYLVKFGDSDALSR